MNDLSDKIAPNRLTMHGNLVESKQQLKSDYLESMGIQPWFPRAVLANSLPPLQLSDDLDSEEDVAVVARLHAHQAAEDASVNQAVSENPEAAQQKKVAQQPKAEVQKPKQKVPQARPVRFGLGLYVFGDWLVASSLIDDHALYQDQAISLAGNIVKAIEGQSSPLEYHHTISWPFFSNASADQGVDAARQYVSGVIDHLKEKHETSKLLVFGGVLPKLNSWPLTGRINDSTERLILPSLYKMMDEPALKARAWHEIQSSPFLHKQ